MKQYIAILGSTGSIGETTLRVIDAHQDKYEVFALIAGINVALMFEQALKYKPAYIVMANQQASDELKKRFIVHFKDRPKEFSCEIYHGEEAMCQVVAMGEIDQVVAAIVGGAGLIPTLAAVKAGKRILLANKESLVMAGDFFMQAVKENKATILPIDSEHNAIYQSLPEALQQPLGQKALRDAGIKSLILTGSGGPFLKRNLSTFSDITVAEAIAHPRWSMGSKISVDSATMMNKGLEFIEARWLFNASAEEIEIVLHPESIIHSMVRYLDGSVIAQMGNADMAIPISHALNYPVRRHSPANGIDFFQQGTLTFIEPDPKRYPCLFLAKEASNSGQVATTILNAANEMIVDAFLHQRVSFNQIYELNLHALETMSFQNPSNVEDLILIDTIARIKTTEIINKKALV
ncbi:1-deoxy-D-xylulose-5-phosphate reductoisomerase [Thorsellia kenyensis]|uniref:1-deoxy-D-xylulose 5-phosphate reductoisomerase n=1 Tax=Thorsellia kenyensis TaxID=1549888 RepID=A0ABV6CAQ3_9GAMM